MAATRIDQLPAATLPLAGTELFAIVQAGVAKQVSRDSLLGSGFVNLTTAQTVAGVKTLSDPLRIAAGAVALPGLTPSGDPDTGLWAPAADTLAWSTGGVERMRLAAGIMSFGPPNAAATGNHLYIRKPAGQVAANWYELYATSPFESDTYRDHTYNFGFGRDSTGAKVAGETLLYQQFETKFRESGGSPYKAEWFLAFGRPTDAVVYSRPFKIDMEHVTGNAQLYLSGDVKFLNSLGSLPRFHSPETGTTQLWSEAALQLNSNVNGDALASNIFLQAFPGFPTLSFRNAMESTVLLTAGLTAKDLTIEAMGGVVIRHPAVAAAKRCLLITAAATQSVDVLTIQASDEFTKWSYFNKVGRFHTAVGTAPVLADLANGEGGLWIDPATGNLKVTSRIAGVLKTGTVVVA